MTRTLLQGIGIGLLAIVFGPAVLSAQESSPDATCPRGSLYVLGPKSTYETGCFDPCACPIQMASSIQGSFRLIPGGFDGLYWNYAVKDVEWKVALGTTTRRLTGSGTYRRGGEFAALHQLQLDLSTDGGAPQQFDSGLVSGGNAFPHIGILISMNNRYCFDTVITLDAAPGPEPLPRHAPFVLDPAASSMELSLFVGGTRSRLTGSLQLFLGDPTVPVIALEGMLGLSVERADLVAPDFEPNLVMQEPLILQLDPRVRSIGAWNTKTGAINFELNLAVVEGSLPVPRTVSLSGTLSDGSLSVSGDNGPIADGQMVLHIRACERPLPPPPPEIWFSTTAGFTAGKLVTSSTTTPAKITPGDLLSSRGYVVRTNAQLMRRLGVQPIVPNVGLDAVAVTPGRRILFSFEPSTPRIWSETLGRWLKHGDLLSDAGVVAASNEELLARFIRMPAVADVGLDAVARAPTGEILFSVKTDFFCESQGRLIRRGDLLSNRGRVVQTNAQLLANFRPLDMTAGPLPADFGLDVVILRPNREIWFSTEVDFQDARLGPINDGDLLSTKGNIIRRNLDLLAGFAPLEDLADFGLDAGAIIYPVRIADFDLDSVVGPADMEILRSVSGPASVLSPDPDLGDLDGDGDVDPDDFGLLQRCLGDVLPLTGPECLD